MQKAPLKRVSRRAGRKMNEHRVGLENHVMRTLRHRKAAIAPEESEEERCASSPGHW